MGKKANKRLRRQMVNAQKAAAAGRGRACPHPNQMGPPQPPGPPDMGMGWDGPPYPGGHPGFPDPECNMDDPMGYRQPAMEPPYGGPMEDAPEFCGPVDQDYRFQGTRDCQPTADAGFAPSPMLDQRDMYFGGPRSFHGPPDQDHGHGARMMGWDTSGMDHPGHVHHEHLPPGHQPSSGHYPHPGHGHPGHFPSGPHPPPGQHPHLGHQPPPGQGHPGHAHPWHLPPGHYPSPEHQQPAYTRTIYPPDGYPPGGYPPQMPGPPVPQQPQKGSKKPKLPPRPCTKPVGRAQGVISFVGADYGFIEREDLKKFHFSSQAFWGDPAEMIPGVRVQFTILKDKEKEFATDVGVAPGGTEEVDGEILPGVISQAPDIQANGTSRKLTLRPKVAGLVRAEVSGETVDIPFTTHDYRPTLLVGDRVVFNMLTDMVTKKKRATNIALTRLTKEIRQTGVVMNTNDDNGSGSIMSEEWSNLGFDAEENLSGSVLKVMDEVEFTVVPTPGKEQHKAVRVRRLPEGTVRLCVKTREKIAEAMEKNSTRFTLEQGKWKAVSNEVLLPQRTVVFEDVGSEQFKGTIILTPTKASEKEKTEATLGLLVAMVAGTDRKLPFGISDVTTEATMMPGDRVHFNICTKRCSAAERATNIELLLDGLDHSQEQREKGVVRDLRESFGFIRCQQDPQLFFHLKEVLEENKLNLLDEVEFTVLPASTGDGNQAVRVKKLLRSAFTATPKLEGLGLLTKSKNKMTIKLLRDSVNDEIKNLKVQIESFSTESATDEDPPEPVDENARSGKQEAGDSIPEKSENGSQPVKMEEQGCGVEVKAQEETSSSSDGTVGQKKDASAKGESRNGAAGGSGDRSRGTHSGKYRSPPRDRSKRRSRSRSGERGHRHERRRSHSGDRGRRNERSRSRDRGRRHERSRSRDRGHRHERSHSRERSGRNGSGRRRSRSRSRERAESYSRRHEGSRESTHRSGQRRSKSPERDGGSRQKVATGDKDGRPAKEKQGGKELPKAYRYSNTMELDATGDKDGRPAKDNQDGKEPLPKANRNPATLELPRSENIVDEELSRKKRELELLEEHIARKRAIIAMEQKGLPLKGQSSNGQDAKSFQYVLEPESPDKPSPAPMKSILKKRTEPFTEVFQQSEIPKSLPVTPNPVSQSCFATASVDIPPFLQASEKSYFEPAPNRTPYNQLVSQREPVGYPPLNQSAVHQPPLDPPPVSHSPPRQQAPAQSAASTQFERFLRTLNKGVDAKLLSSLVKEARVGEGLAHEAAESRLPPQGETFYKKDEDRYEDSHRKMAEEPDDFLLPHERAFQDGSGFSQIVGMKHGPPPLVAEVEEKEDSWRGGDVEDEERFLYGEGTDEGELQSPAVEGEEADRRGGQEPRRVEAKPTLAEERMAHYDNIQSLLETIGLDLDLSEVSKLKDRTQERLYGKKQKSKQVDYGSGRSSGRSGRHRSQTYSPESDRTRSISPVSSSRREVYMSFPGTREHDRSRDRERFDADAARCFESLRRRSRSPSHSTPVSSPKYSHVPQEAYSPYQSAPAHSLAYGQQASAAMAAWNQVPGQAEVLSPVAFSQHPGAYVNPQYPGAYVNPQQSGSYLTPQPLGPYVTPQHPDSYHPQHPGSYNPQHPGSYDPQHLVVYVNPQQLGSYDPQHSVAYDPQHPVPYAGPPSPYVSVPVGPHQVSPYLPSPSHPPVTSGPPAPTETYLQHPNRLGMSRCLQVIKTVQIPRPNKGKKGKNLKAVPAAPQKGPQPTLRPVPPTPSPAPSESAAKKQVMAMSEDIVKAKQKKRLEQFNERMRQKKVKQMEAMKSRVKRKSQEIPQGKTCTEVKNVWVCGHSLVFWAEKRATSPEYGMQLGMDPYRVRVWWKGMQGMTWDQLLPMLLQLKGTWPNPDVIILHLGGNDLGKSDLGLLLAAVKTDLASLRGIFPGCRLVWSDILPRRSWRATDDAAAMEKIRAVVNQRVRANIAELGGAAVTHDSIRPGSDAGLYRPDGVHLSGRGIDMFNIDLQDFLERWEREETQSGESGEAAATTAP